MFCWNCGSQVLDYAKYCPSCGSGRHGPSARQGVAETREVLRTAVDDAVRKTRRAADSARPAVERGAEAVERAARRVRDRVSQK